jgi:Zn-dependent protease with chaperone function
MADILPSVFCDGVIEAQVAHGVARVTLTVTGKDGKAAPCATLYVPVSQLPALVNGMGNLLKQIEDRVRAQAVPQQPKAEGSPAPATNAFRFGS